MQYSISSMKLKAVEVASSPPLPHAEQAQRSAPVGTRWHPPPNFSFIGLYCWGDGAGSRAASIGTRWHPPPILSFIGLYLVFIRFNPQKLLQKRGILEYHEPGSQIYRCNKQNISQNVLFKVLGDAIGIRYEYNIHEQVF